MPATESSPLVALSRSANMRSSVDFPQPDGPMTETNSPACTFKLTLSTASSVPVGVSNIFETPVASSPS